LAESCWFHRYTRRTCVAKDYAHDNKQRIMTLTAIEFLRRFCQHVLPRGFVRIRHFGYLASAHRTYLLALARQQLACQPQTASHLANSPLAIWRCPRCGATMNIGPNLTAQQLAYRCKLTDSS
jgi:Putative transposase